MNMKLKVLARLKAQRRGAPRRNAGKINKN
jgi:hypothetical protein